MSNIAMNILAHVYYGEATDTFLLGVYYGVKMLSQGCTYMQLQKSPPSSFPKWMFPLTLLPAVYERCRCAVELHCSFNSHFPDNW